MAKHLELAVSDAQRLLLERKREPVDNQETNQVPRWPHRQVAELQGLRRPVAERQLPGQVEQSRASFAQPQLRKAGTGDRRGVRQSFLRRYAVTLAS